MTGLIKNNGIKKNKKRHKKNVYRNRRKTIVETRAFVLDYLKRHPCKHCGMKDTRCLEFDHVGKKRKNISMMLASGYGVNAVKKELEYCQVLCANCHRIKTSKDQNWYKSN